MSEPCIELRDCRAEDRAFLYEVYASTRTEELSVVPWSDRERSAFLRSQFDAQDSYYRQHFPDCQFSVIQVDGQDAGRLYLDRRAEEFRIVDIALLPAWRRKGIGATILHRILEESGRDRLPVRIHVEIGNPARGLYDRLGFRTTGEAGVYELMEWRPESN
jgi:ribosomal protein S18 acetylase RimI-like enzyme